jgi:hypothetical protein
MQEGVMSFVTFSACVLGLTRVDFMILKAIEAETSIVGDKVVSFFWSHCKELVTTNDRMVGCFAEEAEALWWLVLFGITQRHGSGTRWLEWSFLELRAGRL